MSACFEKYVRTSRTHTVNWFILVVKTAEILYRITLTTSYVTAHKPPFA